MTGVGSLVWWWETVVGVGGGVGRGGEQVGMTRRGVAVVSSVETGCVSHLP